VKLVVPPRSATARSFNPRDFSGHGFDDLPLPGRGRTLERWRGLAAAAERDLSTAKLFEAHLDALAIIDELHGPSFPGASSWGVWAAESGAERLQLRRLDSNRVALHGSKTWCSGAALLSHALVTAWQRERGPFLVAVALQQRKLHVNDDGWQAVGMAGTATGTVSFDGASGLLIGGENAYLTRPGFWHGAAGIAACWFGGAKAIADAVCTHLRGKPRGPGPHAAAHVGGIDICLRQTAALLREAANWIDCHPTANAMPVALRVRGAAEAAAQAVLEHAGRTLGAAAYCTDARFARMAADLPVFLRQSHAEQDLAELGGAVAAEYAGRGDSAWAL
jgi:hypothetical protein